MNPPTNPADPSSSFTRAKTRPRLNPGLPVAQSLRSTYVSLFNFPPSDFSFYQKAPPAGADSLRQNLLCGAFRLDRNSSLSATALKIAGGSSATTLTALTIELWVRLPTDAESSSYLFTYSDGHAYVKLSNPNNLRLTIPPATTTSGAVTSSSTASSSGYFDTGTSIADGLWHHIAVVIGADKRVSLTVDTRVVPLPGSPAFATMLKDAGTFVVANSAAGASNGCNGYVGQIRLWKSARSLPQIIMEAGTATPSEGLSDLSLYWGNEVDVAAARALDSSLTHNDGTVTLSSQAPSPWWDTTQRYGALEDTAHLSAHPVNMTGNVRFDAARLQAVRCTSSFLSLDASATALTVEFWIKADSVATATAVVIVALQLIDDSGTSRALKIRNPRALEVSWAGLKIQTSVDICDGHWHHVALVWNWAAGTGGTTGAPQWSLYRDAALIGSLPDTEVVAIGTDPHLIIGGDGSDDASKYFSGCLSEFRLWQSARSQSEVLDDASYRLVTPPAALRLYWPFGRDFRPDNRVEDFSSYNSLGYPVNSPDWEDDLLFGVYANHLVIPPTPSPTSGAGEPVTTWNPGELTPPSADGLLDGAAAGFPRVSAADLTAALQQAKETGFFDPRYFPNIRGVKSTDDLAAARAAIADLASTVFLTYWNLGRRLDLVRRSQGRFAYRFIPAPLEVPTARLMLVETYRLSAYLGDLGTGPVVRSFTLMPGENTAFSVSTFKETAATAEAASSIFDSYNESSQRSFEQALGTDRNSETSEAAELDFFADAEVKQRWGTGNADVSAGLNASGDLAHSSFYQQTTNAVMNHAAEASSARNVDVNTSYSVQEQENRQTSLTREIRNINSGRTLDLIFSQLMQEYLTVLHLVDIRVGYYDPNPGSYRVVALSALDALLAEVLIDDADLRLSYKQTIIHQVRGLVAQCRMAPLQAFVVCRDKTTGEVIDTSELTAITANQAFAVDAESYTNYQFPLHTDVVLRVPGLVMAQTSVVLRTDNVVAEAWVGESVGLDAYSVGLQVEQLQRQRWENELRQAEAARLAQANAIIANDDATKAGLYAQVFPSPRINNNVLYADETGRPSPV